MTWLARIAAALAVLWIAVVIGTALARIGYPFELEWMGGAFLDHVARVLDGEPVYVAPSERYVPFLYAPLYFYAAAGMAQVTGEGFVASRLVSLLATVATFALVARLAWHLGGRRRPAVALCAAGLYASGYVVVDTWYDLTRADSLFVAFTAGALLRLETCRGRTGALAAAVLLVVAYFTKQTALLLAPPFAVALAIRAPRLGLWFGGAFAVLWGGANLLVDRLHDGWFWYYTFTLPRRHEYAWELFGPFWRHDLMPLWPIAAAALLWAGRGLAVRDERRTTLSRGAWALGLVLAALSSRLHVGGAINVIMPAILAFAVLGPALWARSVQAGSRLAPVAGALVVCQLLVAWVEIGTTDDPHPPRLFSPRRYLPSAADRAAGEELVTLLREADGDVLVPLHGYWPRLAGKNPGAHVMALIDVQRSGEPELWQRLLQEFLDSARSREAAVVVLDENVDEPLPQLVVPGYRPVRHLVDPASDVLMPPVGLQTRPIAIFRPAR